MTEEKYPFAYKTTWSNRHTETAATLLFEHPRYYNLLVSTVELVINLYDVAGQPGGVKDSNSKQKIAAHIEVGMKYDFEDSDLWKINYMELADCFWGVFIKGENGELEGMILIPAEEKILKIKNDPVDNMTPTELREVLTTDEHNLLDIIYAQKNEEVKLERLLDLLKHKYQWKEVDKTSVLNLYKSLVNKGYAEPI